MADQLSGVAIIIFIAFGILTFLLLFIFANRQIKRFSLKSRAGPHVPIASDASKSLHHEIDRRLDIIKSFQYQPKLLKPHEEQLFLGTESEVSKLTPLHLYRMKALDSLYVLESSIKSTDPNLGQLFGQNLRLCLMRFFQKKLFYNIENNVVQQFADLYEFSRHEPGEFGYTQCTQFAMFLHQLNESLSPAHRRKLHTAGCSKQFLNVPSPSVAKPQRPSTSHDEEEISTLSVNVVPSSPQEDEGNEEEKKSTYETSV